MNPAAEQPSPARPIAGGDVAALLESYGLLCADEALSVVRHDVLNRVTAVGALSYELRQRLRAPGRGNRSDPDAAGRDGEGDDFTRARLDDLGRQVGLLTETVSRRLAPPSVSDDSTDVREAVAVVQALLPLAVQVDIPARLRVAMSPLHLQVVLLAVLSNGARASQLSGNDRLSVSAQLVEGKVILLVDDQGPGLSAEGRERCFERFFSTWPGHAGLGLSVARTLVLRAGGEITAHNRADDTDDGTPGARVLITLAVGPGGGRGRA